MPKVVTRVDPTAFLAALMSRDPGDDVESRVLAAAAEQLQLHGLHGFEVDVIAETSGVGRSTIYRRFGNRNQLIAAALAHGTERFFAVLAESVADIGDPVEQVVVAFSTGLRLAHDEGIARLVRAEPQLIDLLTVEAEMLLSVASARLADVARDRFPDVDPARAAVVAELLVRLAVSFVVLPGSVLPVDDDPEAAVRTFVEPLLAPFGPRP